MSSFRRNVKNKFITMLTKKYHLRINIPILLVTLSFLFLIVHYLSSANCSSNDKMIQEKSKFKLIILILTSPENLEQRDTIRKTWLSEKHASVKHLFATGIYDILPEQKNTLLSEKHKFNDLLLLPKLQDSYGTLTKKLLYSLKDINKDYDFDYLLKCDDDTYVIVHKILRELDKWQNKGTKRELYWGFFTGKAQVKRSGPWREMDWILCDYYLPYALGGGYLLSYNLIQFIVNNMEILKLYNSEDVSVGLWLAPLANIERKHDVRFDTEYRSRGCSNQYIVTHKQTIRNMRNMYEYYQASGALCPKEIRNRMSYRYNWTVPPSQCCTRQTGIP